MNNLSFGKFDLSFYHNFVRTYGPIDFKQKLANSSHQHDDDLANIVDPKESQNAKKEDQYQSKYESAGGLIIS